METFEVGQQVRIVAPRSVFDGNVGVVREIHPFSFSCATVEIHMDGIGNMVYLSNELEAIQEGE